MLLSLTFFFFNDTATTEIYTLSLHDALPIYDLAKRSEGFDGVLSIVVVPWYPVELQEREELVSVFLQPLLELDRKSTRLNSSHTVISYAVFCLKKKKQIHKKIIKRITNDTCE